MRTLAIAILLAGSVWAQEHSATLRAGAAKIDITPPADASLPMSGYAGRGPHTGIHDPIYVRAIVLDDGKSQAAIISGDVIGFTETLWEQFTGSVAKETGIPRENILLAGVHTHGAPTPGVPPGETDEKRIAWAGNLAASVVEVAKQAKAALQPARVGFGTGRASVNTNRVARAEQGGWLLGVNPDGPSDKTVAVLKFEDVSGQLIALFVNYPVHGTVMGQENRRISGDLPGATSRCLEEKYGGNVVAVWTSGAAGDQNAIYGPGNNFSQVAILGRILGEEAARVAGEIRTYPRARLFAKQKVITCSGQRAPQGVSPARDLNIQFQDGPPVNIRLSLLQIGPVALAGVSGEVLTKIGERLKKESPLAHTVMVTHANGSSGYLPDDASYRRVSYEIVTSRVKPGCAESSIVNGLLDLMQEY